MEPEDGLPDGHPEGSIESCMDGYSVSRPQDGRLLRLELEESRLVLHREVVRHRTLLPDGEQERQIIALEGPVEVCLPLRRHGELRVVLSEIRLYKKPVRCVPRRDLRETQLLHQPVLERTERPLHPSLRLGTAGVDELDVELLERPGILRDLVSLRIVDVHPIDAVPIDIQGYGSTFIHEVCPRGRQEILRRLVRDEGTVQEAARCIIDEEEQGAHRPPVLEPRVIRPVELDQFAHTFLSFPPSPRNHGTATDPPEAVGDHPAAERLGIDDEPVMLFELLGREGRSEVGIAFPYGRQGATSDGRISSAIPRTSAELVEETLRSVLSVRPEFPLDVADGETQFLRCLLLGDAPLLQLLEQRDLMEFFRAHGDERLRSHGLGW